MATHTFTLAPNSNYPWDNTDRPDSIDVYVLDFTGAATGYHFVKTIPGTDLSSIGHLSVTLDEADTMPGADGSFWFSFVGRGMAAHYIEKFYSWGLQDGAWPDSSFDQLDRAAGATTLPVDGHLRSIADPGVAMPAGVEVAWKAQTQYSKVETTLSTTTLDGGAISFDMPYGFEEPTSITAFSTSHPELYLVDPNSMQIDQQVAGVTLNFDVYLKEGTNSIVLDCPTVLPDGGTVRLYTSEGHQAMPPIDLDPGQSQARFDYLGERPYLIEIYVRNYPTHDWDGWWPHVDERAVEDGGDPDAWDATKAEKFTLKPGLNDLGTFHINDYPRACVRVLDRPMAHLRHVGFSTKAAALLTSGKRPGPKVTIDFDLADVPAAADHALLGTVTWSGVPATQEYDAVTLDGVWYFYIFHDTISDNLPSSGSAPVYKSAEPDDFSGDLLARIESLFPGPGNPAPGTGRVVGPDWGPYTADVLPGLNEPPLTLHDLIHAGFSPRQAKTWLKVLGMDTPVLTKLSAPDYGQDLYWITGYWSGGTLPNGWYFEPTDTAQTVEGMENAGTFWHEDAPSGRYLAFYGTTNIGDPAPASWPVGFTPTDPRLKALLRGGFTRLQAKLLINLLEG